MDSSAFQVCILTHFYIMNPEQMLNPSWIWCMPLILPMTHMWLYVGDQ